jgi:hypothetical protein
VHARREEAALAGGQGNSVEKLGEGDTGGYKTERKEHRKGDAGEQKTGEKARCNSAARKAKRGGEKPSRTFFVRVATLRR